MLFAGCASHPKRTDAMQCPLMTFKAEAALTLAAHEEPELGWWVRELARFCDAL